MCLVYPYHLHSVHTNMQAAQHNHVSSDIWCSDICRKGCLHGCWCATLFVCEEWASQTDHDQHSRHLKRGAKQAAWCQPWCLSQPFFANSYMVRTQSCYAVCTLLTACYTVAGNLKLTFPIAVAATQLAWAMIAVPGAFASTPSTKAHLASLKYGTDYLLACRPSSTEFVAQVSPVSWFCILYLLWCIRLLHLGSGWGFFSSILN